MQSRGLLAAVRQAPLKALLRARVAGLLMLLKARRKARLVHRQAVLGGQLLGHLDREAVGIVELEGVHAVDHGAALHAGYHLVEFALSLAQRAGKARFLELQLLEHEGLVLLKLRVYVPILCDDDLGDLAGEALSHPQLHAEAHSAADEAA